MGANTPEEGGVEMNERGSEDLIKRERRIGGEVNYRMKEVLKVK